MLCVKVLAIFVQSKMQKMTHHLKTHMIDEKNKHQYAHNHTSGPRKEHHSIVAGDKCINDIAVQR